MVSMTLSTPHASRRHPVHDRTICPAALRASLQPRGILGAVVMVDAAASGQRSAAVAWTGFIASAEAC